ncbi:MAG: metallophosphoesterase family protein [Calditrichaceae bacterium]|jgi:putative phosphoesterase
MKIAFLSDIHGNTWALKAVLEDLSQRDIQGIYDLGDSLYGPLDPKGTFHLLQDRKIQSICGNQDRYIVESMHQAEINPTLQYVENQLNDKALEWLRALPPSRTIDDHVYLCHGTPGNDSEYLIEELHPEYVGVKDFNRIEIALTDIKQKIVICGHSHRPGFCETPEKLVINPGSVGLPAYCDDHPIPHKIENYSPKARYCIVDFDRNMSIEQISVSYDFENAALAAEANDRGDWAQWLRTGLA